MEINVKYKQNYDFKNNDVTSIKLSIEEGENKKLERLIEMGYLDYNSDSVTVNGLRVYPYQCNRVTLKNNVLIFEAWELNKNRSLSPFYSSMSGIAISINLLTKKCHTITSKGKDYDTVPIELMNGTNKDVESIKLDYWFEVEEITKKGKFIKNTGKSIFDLNKAIEVLSKL